MMGTMSGYEVGLQKVSHSVPLTFRYVINSSQGCYCGYLLLITFCLQIASVLPKENYFMTKITSLHETTKFPTH